MNSERQTVCSFVCLIIVELFVLTGRIAIHCTIDVIW